MKKKTEKFQNIVFFYNIKLITHNADTFKKKNSTTQKSKSVLKTVTKRIIFVCKNVVLPCLESNTKKYANSCAKLASEKIIIL